MNNCIDRLLMDSDACTKLVTGLPQAFEMAGLEMPGNPAVGFLREHAITAFFKSYFKEQVIIPVKGNQKSFDIIVCEKELSIKTVSNNNGVKVLWTADTESVLTEIGGGYKPDCDIFLVRIFWGKCEESIFYIPKEVQIEIFDQVGSYKYLKSKTKTNNRGIEISKPIIKEIENHSQTKKLCVDWQKLGMNYTPYDRWEKFWESITP